MAVKFTYRGKTIEELKSMDTREFSKLAESRIRRSILRKFDVIDKFIARCKKSESEKKMIKTHGRDIIVVPKLIDFTINIYNGKSFTKIKITPEMLGHRLGEFAPTRKKVEHGSPGIGATRSSAALSVK